jgi:acyl carrier protein
MKTQEFIKNLQEALDLEKKDLTTETNLKTLDGYDSMSVMTIIALADEHFSKKLTAQQLASITTVRSLIELIGTDHFSD